MGIDNIAPYGTDMNMTVRYQAPDGTVVTAHFFLLDVIYRGCDIAGVAIGG